LKVKHAREFKFRMAIEKNAGTGVKEPAVDSSPDENKNQHETRVQQISV